MIVLFMISFLVGCNENVQVRDEKYNASNNHVISEKKTKGIVKKKNLAKAIYYVPNEEMADSLRNTIGEDNFSIVLNDNVAYFEPIVNYLDSLDILVEMSNDSVFKFIGQDSNKEFIINRKDLDSQLWGILVFNGQSKPISVDLEDFKEKIPIYFDW